MKRDVDFIRQLIFDTEDALGVSLPVHMI